MSHDLPPDLAAALEQLAEGRSHRALAARAAALSRLYREGSRSTDVVHASDDALAYALTRLPATYAAAAAALAAASQALPTFAPRTLLDVGAGPGTAAWAAARCFPEIARIRLVDDNGPARVLALALNGASSHPALRDAAYETGTLAALTGEASDLVIASYLVGELPPDALAHAAEALWSRTAAMLVVIEPGTPAGFLRIRELRAELVGRGAHVVAPCPHDGPCPIVAPDWCHFAQRLARSREHRLIKGAALSYEDEKFSYVALARQPPVHVDARVLAHPRVGKAGVIAKLCTTDGIIEEVTPRRERVRYKARTRWRWGDAVSRPAGEASESP